MENSFAFKKKQADWQNFHRDAEWNGKMVDIGTAKSIDV